MKFLTLTLAAALTLAFSFTATPAAALGNLPKCRVYNAKIKMNYAKCLELDNLLVEKGKAAKGICDSKRTASLEKATAKFVTKLSVSPEDCGIDTATTEADQALQLLASSDESLTAAQEVALASAAVFERLPIFHSFLIEVCETAGGTWESDACTPAERDCFRDGVCGVDGFDYGAYAGVDKSSSGCDVAPGGSGSYNSGSVFAGHVLTLLPGSSQEGDAVVGYMCD